MCLLLGSMHWFNHFATFLHYGMWHVWWWCVNYCGVSSHTAFDEHCFSLSEIESSMPHFVLQILTNFSSLAWRDNRWEGEKRTFWWRSETTELRPSTISHYCSVASLKHPLSLIKLQQVNLVGFHYCRKRTMLFSSCAVHNFRLYRLFWSLIEHLAESRVSVLQTNHFWDVSRLHRGYVVRGTSTGHVCLSFVSIAKIISGHHDFSQVFIFQNYIPFAPRLLCEPEFSLNQTRSNVFLFLH